MKDSINSIDEKIIAYINRLSRAMRKSYNQIGFEEGLNPLQIQILEFLSRYNRKKITINYIAAEMEVSEATVSDSIKVLVERGLLRKTSDELDKRIRYVEITQEGKFLINKIEKKVQIQFPEMELKDKQKLVFLLHTLTFEFFKSGYLTNARICFSCMYYERHKNNKHYCNLLKETLEPLGLRYDCPDHHYSKDYVNRK